MAPRQSGVHARFALVSLASAMLALGASQHLQVSFAPSETRIVHSSGFVAFRLAGYGCGDQLRQPELAQLVRWGNHTEYRRGLLTEWYVNDASGLEQGFTLANRPPAQCRGPLVIALDLTGGLNPQLKSRSEIALVDSTGRGVLRYGNLKAWDAHHQPLESHLEVQNRQIRLLVDESRAAYPITIDPTVTAVTLLASDGVSSDEFGESVSVDGATAVFGAFDKHTLQGAAYVFVQSGSTWTQQAKLTASDGASGDQFGISVSVSGDTAVVGAFGKSSGQGAAYVFVRSDGIWSQQAELTASDGAGGDQFGISVSVNGATAVIGAASQASGQGAAYVFVQSGSTWTQQAKLTASDGAAGDKLGASVSVNSGTVVAGAPGKASTQGAAYVFLQSGSTWTQQAKLTASDGAAGDSFGNAASLSGNTAVVGAYAKNSSQGSAYVFARSGASWAQQAELTASDGKPGDHFGKSVGVDSGTVVAGANARSFNTGAAYVFVSSGSTWSQQAELVASDATESYQFAFSVAVSGDTVAAGAPIQFNGTGRGYFFARAAANWAQQAEIGASDAASPDDFGWAVAVSGNTAVVGALFKNGFAGAAYVFVNSGAGWTQQAKLVPSDAAGGEFGNAVAIDGDTVVVGANEQSSGAGAAYVFVRSGASWTQQAKLTASDGAANDYFGIAVSISGGTIAIGAVGNNNVQGAVYIFVQTGTSWAQQAELTLANAANEDQLGGAISVDGDTVVAGAVGRNTFQGAAEVFVRSGTTWSQQAELTASDGAKDDFFGHSAYISGDTAIVSALNKNFGAAYVFVRTGASWTQQAKLNATGEAVGDQFGSSVSLDGDMAAIGAQGVNSGTGSAYVFARSGASWTQLAQLSAAGGATGDSAGWAVSINAGTVVSGAIGRDASQGAAYVFSLPSISAGGVVHAASFAHTVAPGSIISVFGTNFAAANTSAGVLPLPTILGGVSVTVNGTLAPLIFAGPLQANVQAPFETATGTASVVVIANGIPSPPSTLTVATVAPGIFVTGANQAVALNPDTSVADSSHPAKVGTVLVMYVTGLGPLDHPIPTGSPASSNPLSNATIVPTVTIGGVNAPVSFAGMTPTFVGLGQINIQVPKLANGTYPVVVSQGGQTSNNPTISVTQ